MVTIVNGRVVRNIEINRCIQDSYHTYKPDDKYPIVVLNIAVDTTLTDVNIHPTKQDIKFGKIDALLELISKTIKNALDEKILIPKIENKDEEIETLKPISMPTSFVEEKVEVKEKAPAKKTVAKKETTTKKTTTTAKKAPAKKTTTKKETK